MVQILSIFSFACLLSSSHLVKYLFKSFAYLFLDYLLSLLNFDIFIYLHTSSFQICVLQIFSPCLQLVFFFVVLFHFLKRIFELQAFSHLVNILLHVCSSALCGLINVCLAQDNRCLYIFLFSSSAFLFLLLDVPLFQYHVLKTLFFSP